MDALTIVVGFDVGEHVAPCFVPRRPSALMGEFDLERVEEAFHPTGSQQCSATRQVVGGTALLDASISQPLLALKQRYNFVSKNVWSFKVSF